ncbi:MAG: hypothetical protein Q9166_003810 [cf. Caloplaca sp. 2 TL-2023]
MKEPGHNNFRSLPKLMADFITVLCNTGRSPWLSQWLWLKPRGLDRLFGMLAQKNLIAYKQFIESNLSYRIAQEKNEEKKAMDAGDVRKDLFHYLFHAKYPETGGSGYTMEELLEETSLLVVAGSDTTSTVVPAMFFYMARNPLIQQKLTNEIQNAFSSGDEIHAGP